MKRALTIEHPQLQPHWQDTERERLLWLAWSLYVSVSTLSLSAFMVLQVTSS